MTELLVKQRLRSVQSDSASEETPEATFAKRARELRERLKMTQAALSSHIEITSAVRGRPMKLDPTAITKLEKGTRSIRLNEAVAIASALDQTVDEMLRPALPPKEQIRSAEQQVEHTDWRARWALGEHEASKARLGRLRELWRYHVDGPAEGDVHDVERGEAT